MKNAVIVGQTIEVMITGIQPYGAFAMLADGSSGLIHISEISDRYVKSIDTFVHVGQKVTVKVIDIDNISKQARLSLKALDHQLKRKEKRTTYHHPRRSIKETPLGFSSLEQQLPIWIEETLQKLGGNNHDKA